jgi:predicted thioesterase
MAAGGQAMNAIPVGARGTFEMVVGPDQLANRFKDATLPAVLATPVMILLMENAALNAIKPYLAPGYTAVGTHIDVAHLAATPVGHRVTGEAEVTRVDGRRIEFVVRAFDGLQQIGAGTHQRALIELARFNERLVAAKGAG